MSPRRLRTLDILAAACAALAAAGCGVTAGSSPNAPIELTVTRDFGAEQVLEVAGTKVASDETVVDVLRRRAKVTSSDGRSVQAIDGVRPTRGYGWFAYVNGILADEDDGTFHVHGGDRVWWDYRPTPAVRAVVGSYPEPFLHGSGGKRLPVRVECVDPQANACSAVADKLLALGVPIGRSNISRSAADESLRILVGRWAALRGRDAESDAIDAGPQRSGVFARFDAAAQQLTVLDPRGRAVRMLGAGSGLIATTRAQQRQPVWFVTGTDDAGVASAARALDEGALSSRYALAISHDLPVQLPFATG